MKQLAVAKQALPVRTESRYGTGPGAGPYTWDDDKVRARGRAGALGTLGSSATHTRTEYARALLPLLAAVWMRV